MDGESVGNEAVAAMLERIGDLLEAGQAGEYRVAAYRRAADGVREASEPVADMVREGRKSDLDAIPGVGERIAGLIEEYVNTGRSGLLERLEAETSPEAAIAQVPGIGEELARRVVDSLGVRTLEELELAAHDGRLDGVPGFGPERLEGVRGYLAGRLSRSARRSRGEGRAPAERPPVALLLAIDGEYRRRASADDLRRIAPKRFNPEGKAWLPVLEESREGWDFTALFSNTARAHELGKTDDWVVIYYEKDGRQGQATVVTGSKGPLDGRRMVRGREAESRAFYADRAST